MWTRTQLGLGMELGDIDMILTGWDNRRERAAAGLNTACQRTGALDGNEIVVLRKWKRV